MKGEGVKNPQNSVHVVYGCPFVARIIQNVKEPMFKSKIGTWI